MSVLPLHIHSEYFDTREGVLLLNGTLLTEIAERFSGPFYAYDASVISRRLDELRESLPGSVKLHYAMKANPMPELVRFIASRVDGIDVASAGELEVALRTGTDRDEISFAGPGKSVAELAYAIDSDIVINVESETELTRIVELTHGSDARAKVAIRINPDFELKGSGMRMSGGPKPFGIDAERLPRVLRELQTMPVEFQGLHIYSGSQNLSAEAICEAQVKSMELALELCLSTSLVPKFINVGGGFGIPYFAGDKRLSIDSIGENLANLNEQLRASYAMCNIVVELGRYIVGEAGVYVCEITDIKSSRGHTFLVTNGGLHHHLAASGNFGQVLRKNYPVAIANKMHRPKVMNASVVGPLCTPLDVLADKMDFPEAAIGDLVAVFQSGAYGYSASPHGFLSHPMPGEVFCA